MLDQLEHITDPIVRDWSILLSLAFIGIFVFAKWLVSLISMYQERSQKVKETEVSRIEKFLQNELSLSRAEKLELSKEIKAIQSDSLSKSHDIARLKAKLRFAVSRIRYLEKCLYENNVEFAPAMESYDD